MEQCVYEMPSMIRGRLKKLRLASRFTPLAAGDGNQCSGKYLF